MLDIPENSAEQSTTQDSKTLLLVPLVSPLHQISMFNFETLRASLKRPRPDEKTKIHSNGK